MRQDSRLSRMLHVLIHMGQSPEPLRSETIAKMLNMNSVVVRRTLAGLRESGYVISNKGHGGGWILAKPLSKISLFDIYKALGEPNLFALGLSDDSRTCLVEKSVNEALTEGIEEASAMLLTRFKRVTLSELAKDFEHKMTKAAKNHDDHKANGRRKA